jgi:hypothetical protein
LQNLQVPQHGVWWEAKKRDEGCWGSFVSRCSNDSYYSFWIL